MQEISYNKAFSDTARKIRMTTNISILIVFIIFTPE